MCRHQGDRAGPPCVFAPSSARSCAARASECDRDARRSARPSARRRTGGRRADASRGNDPGSSSAQAEFIEKPQPPDRVHDYPVTIPQGGIFALGTASHAYLELDSPTREGAPALVRVVASLREPRTTMGGGSTSWQVFAPSYGPASYPMTLQPTSKASIAT